MWSDLEDGIIGGDQTAALAYRILQGCFAGTAWTRCDSWYRDEHGRIVANWPGYMREYLGQTRALDPSEYLFTPPAGRSGDEQVADVAGGDPARQPAALADA